MAGGGTSGHSELPGEIGPDGTGDGGLGGRTILLPRAERPGHHDRLAQALGEAGAHVVRVPLTRTRPGDPAALTTALEQLAGGTYQWVIITSPRTVDSLDRVDPAGEPGSRPPDLEAARPTHPLATILCAARGSGTRVAAVGRASAQALTELGATVDVVAAGFSAALLSEDALTRAIPARGRLLLPCSRISPPDLAEGLRRAGWQVDTVAAYDTAPVDAHDLTDSLREDWARGRFDAIVITSASTSRAASDLLAAPHPDTRLVALGTASARAVSTFLRTPDAVATSPTPSAVVDALREALRDRPLPRPDQENL
ncbi:uroporphyrinogen-III synthase [Schaalia naturae]|uniref:Uroporphyrinogen-III synthase n=1 Tax=Schaalia naturae TaxID=635203 RepID=A0ABW2SQY3_9ACTO